MIAASYNISLYQGDSYSVAFILRDVLRDQSNVPILSTSGNYVAGLALNLSAATVTAQIRTTEDDPSVAASFTVVKDTNTTGKVTLSLSPAQTSLLSIGRYDVQVTFADNSVLTVLRGAIKTTKDVTHG
jgi:hypothetical protein